MGTDRGTVGSLTTAQFADKSNFSGWNFTKIWIIKDGYPQLRCFLSE